MNESKAPLVLVDGSSYLFRAYHAMPNLTTADGIHTGAIYGVINMINKLIAEYKPQQMAIIFDAKGKTFRSELYQEYKAHRPPMPEELAAQIAPLHELIEALGLPCYAIAGVEADDVIGTIARAASAQQINTLISTGDKDLAQLVNEYVTLIDTMKNVLMTPESVKTRFGVGPELIVDYLALMGDKADNIPGVPGVGEKTALALLQQIGSLDNLYENTDAIAGLALRGAKSVAKKIADNKEMAYLSYELATIKCDVALDFSIADLKIREKNTAELARLYQTLEFKTWYKALSEEAGAAPASPKNQYILVTEKEAFNDLVAKVEQTTLVALDTETTSLNYLDAELVGLSLALSPHVGYYIPLAHDYEGAPEQLPRDWVLSRLNELLMADPGKFVLQNAKYDAHIFANYGIELKAIAHDTMLQSYISNSVGSRHDMDSMAKKYLDVDTIKFEDVAGKGKKQLTFNAVPVEKALHYAAEDAAITLQLHHVLWPKIESEASLLALYHDIERPLLSVLQRIERNGVLIDKEQLVAQSDSLANALEEIESSAYGLAGKSFNLGSPKQLQEVLFDDLELPIIKKTPKGQPSTAEEVLQELANYYELPRVILRYRSLSKLKSTYTDKLPLQIKPSTGRVHTSYHQAVAATGRLSSTDPNLQNIPVKTEEGRKIRSAFIAGEGNTILAADYSQVELRIMAHLSGDAGLVNAFAENKDIHRATAAEIFDLEEADVTTEQRRRAKAVNFGLIYGMSAFGLAKQLAIPRDEAQHYINTYFARYPGVEDYMNTIRAKAHEQGYVETLFGRRLYLPEIRSSNGMRRKAAERTAINAPMQGSAADIIKQAMLRVDAWIRQDAPAVKMIMQVHDELVFEVPTGLLEAVQGPITERMQQAANLRVPLIVDVGTGQNWDEAH